MKVIRRLSFLRQGDDTYLDMLLDNHSKYPNSFTDVWLATAYGFPPMQSHKKYAQDAAYAAARFRSHGIGVSLQLSNSVGHGQYILYRDCSAVNYELKDAQPMVGHDGTLGVCSFCYNDPIFRKYTLEEVRLYIEAVKPEEFWIDDDLRARNHKPVDFGCFCPKCMADFNSRHGTAYTRQQLVKEMITDSSLRGKWVAFLREGLASLITDICKVVKECSPNTSVGLENGDNGPYTGYGHDYIFEAIQKTTGLAPMYRAGGGSYNDHDPNLLTDKAYRLAYQNAMLPDFVSIKCPEIENTPNAVHGKTMYGTALEATLHLANGSNYVSFAMLGMEEDAFYSRGLELFSQHYDYWKRLAAVSSETTGGGVSLAFSRKPHLKTLTEADTLYTFNAPYARTVENLTRNGLPLTYEPSDVYILCRERARDMQDEELKHLLSKRVITDGATAELIQSRGINLGLKLLPMTALEGSIMTEQLTDHPANRHSPREYRAAFFSPGETGFSFITQYPENSEVLGTYTCTVDYAPKTEDTDCPFGAASVILHTAAGGKWAVIGNGLWKYVKLASTQERLLDIIDYIAEKPLPARVECTRQALIMPRVKDGRTVAVSVTNVTIEPQENVKLTIRRPAGTRFNMMSFKNGNGPLEAVLEDDAYTVTIPQIAPWSIITVFCDE